MAMITGVPPLVRWLQRFRFDPQQPGVTDSISGQVSASASASLVLGSGVIFFSVVCCGSFACATGTNVMCVECSNSPFRSY